MARQIGIGAGSEHGASMGSWLDKARRETLIGVAEGADGDGAPGTVDPGTQDLDDDEAALAAYNARLAELNRRYR